MLVPQASQHVANVVSGNEALNDKLVFLHVGAGKRSPELPRAVARLIGAMVSFRASQLCLVHSRFYWEFLFTVPSLKGGGKKDNQTMYQEPQAKSGDKSEIPSYL
jgi:hypothetical protein